MANCGLLIANIDMRLGASGSRARRLQETAGGAVYLLFENHSHRSQNMAICYIHFFSVVILGELLLTNTGGSYKIVTPAFTLPALIVVFKSIYRMHGYCVGRLYFCMSMSKYRPPELISRKIWRSATYTFFGRDPWRTATY